MCLPASQLLPARSHIDGGSKIQIPAGRGTSEGDMCRPVVKLKILQRWLNGGDAALCQVTLTTCYFVCVYSRDERLNEGLLACISVPLKMASKANALWPTLKELASIANIACKSDLQVSSAHFAYEYKLHAGLSPVLTVLVL